MGWVGLVRVGSGRCGLGRCGLGRCGAGWVGSGEVRSGPGRVLVGSGWSRLGEDKGEGEGEKVGQAHMRTRTWENDKKREG